METLLRVRSFGSRQLPVPFRVCLRGPATSLEATLAGSILGSSGVCCPFSFFPRQTLEKRFPSLIARWREQKQSCTTQRIVSRTERLGGAGTCQALPLHHCHLWVLDQADSLPVVPHQWMISCCSSGHRGGHAAGWLWGEACQALTMAPLPVLRCW